MTRPVWLDRQLSFPRAEEDREEANDPDLRLVEKARVRLSKSEAALRDDHEGGLFSAAGSSGHV